MTALSDASRRTTNFVCKLSSAGVSPYTYNASNQLTAIPGTTYAYDNNGNLITKAVAGGETVNYTWTPEN